MALRQSTDGGSGAFMVLGDDGKRYWCKSLNNFQSELVPVTEQIVARLGDLIGAPVCGSALVSLDELAGWEIRPGTGRVVEPGIAHGSVTVEPVIETRELKHRTDDDNKRRHCGLYALCDWLYGGDFQWLRATAEENAYYSHDHGLFLTGWSWTPETLTSRQNDSVPLTIEPEHLDPDELQRLAEVLEGLERATIEEAVSGLPASWPVSDEALEAVVGFAEARKIAVAGRLRGLVA